MVIVSGRESKVAESDVSRDICLEQDLLPVVEPLAVPVVTLTRSRVEGPLVVARPMDVIFPGRESTVEMSDVNRGICMESDFLPVVMSTVDVGPLAISVVAQTRPRVGRGPDLVVAEGRESLPAYGLDVILSGQEYTVGMSDVFFLFFIYFLFSSNETVHTTSTHTIHTYKHSITYALHNEYIKLARLYLHVKGYVSSYIKSPHLPRYISI